MSALMGNLLTSLDAEGFLYLGYADDLLTVVRRRFAGTISEPTQNINMVNR